MVVFLADFFTFAGTVAANISKAEDSSLYWRFGRKNPSLTAIVRRSRVRTGVESQVAPAHDAVRWVAECHRDRAGTGRAHEWSVIRGPGIASVPRCQDPCSR